MAKQMTPLIYCTLIIFMTLLIKGILVARSEAGDEGRFRLIREAMVRDHVKGVIGKSVD